MRGPRCGRRWPQSYSFSPTGRECGGFLSCPQEVGPFVRASILAAHLACLPEERRERFADAVASGVSLPLDYVRLNVSAIR